MSEIKSPRTRDKGRGTRDVAEGASKIVIQRLSSEEKKRLGIPETLRSSGPWSVWECEPSTFDWRYSDQEVAFVYEGQVKVKAGNNEVHIKAGDLVTFPKGLSCTWQVLKTIRKVYKFER